MERSSTPAAATRPSPAAAVALAALSAATATGLTRVFAGRAWLAAALVAAVAPHLLLATAARRHPPGVPAVAAVAAVGAWYGMVAVAPSTTFFWLPTTSTLEVFGSHLADALTILRTAVVPVDAGGGALLLAVLALWAAALGADFWARRAGGVLAAVSPSLVLFVVVAALGEGSYGAVTAAYAGAAGAFLLLAHHTELTESRSWFHATARRRSRLLAGGALAAVAAALGGVVTGPLLPGARSEALLDYRDLGDKRGPGTWRTVTPLVEIRGRLVQEPPAELFTVRADPEHRYRWRLVALDRFDGEIWGLEGRAPRAGERLPQPEDLQVGTVTVRQDYTITRLASRWVPAAYRPVATDLEGVLVIPESLTLVTDDDLREGVRYTVESQVVAPGDAALAAARPADPEAFARFLELPDDFPEEVTDLAESITSGTAGPYAAARALQDWLREDGGFAYDLEVPSGHSDDALVDFLFEVKRGFCEQFAGSFAAMARAVGLPTRVAVGFLSGSYDQRAGVWRVTTREAHAWPEVYLEGIGWLAFEPTPGRYDHTPGDPTGTGAQDSRDEPASATTAPTVATSIPVPTSARIRPRQDEPLIDAGAPASGGSDRSAWSGALLVMAVLAAVAAVAAAGVAGGTVGAKAWRRSRRARGPSTRERVLGAWDEVLDRLAEAGIEPRPSATSTEFALRQAPAQGVGEGGPPLMALAHLQTEALFALDPPSEEDAAAAWMQASELVKALARSTPAGDRWRRRLDPRPLRRRGRRTGGGQGPARRRWSTKARRSSSKARTSASTSAA